ncbi:hypothetical protein [Achromobacter ruhlandii]|nr:hypothetical protein [Achromobacter ruhlandii]
MSAADYDDRRNQNADVIAYLAKANGRFGAIAATLGSVPGNPYGGLFLGTAKTADVSGWVLGGLEQMLRPKPVAYAAGGVIDVGVHVASDSIPYGSIIFNEIGEYLKSKYAN